MTRNSETPFTSIGPRQNLRIEESKKFQGSLHRCDWVQYEGHLWSSVIVVIPSKVSTFRYEQAVRNQTVRLHQRDNIIAVCDSPSTKYANLGVPPGCESILS